ncbi:MAG: glycosyltransferase [Candidatus Eisenbacteria bacterium]
MLHVDTAADWRGGQAQIAALLDGLAARGHPQWLAAPEGPLSAHARERGIATHGFAPLGDLDLPAALRLAGFAARIAPQVVHLHSARAHATGWWAARRARAVCVVARRVDFPVGRHALSAIKYRLPVEAYVCVSRGIAEVLAQAGIAQQRVRVIHSGIAVESVAGAVERARAEGRDARMRAMLGVPAKAPLVGMIAALAPHKDHATFLAAAHATLERHPETWFVCAGDGPLRDAVRARVRGLGLEERVRLPGFVEDVPALLAALDVFVLSSYLEGLGTSVLDAQAAGVPVVATRVGGIPEMIESGVTGLLVPPRDPEALAAAIAEALSDRAAAALRAQAARTSVLAFDVRRTVERTEALYRELLGARA